MFKLFVKLMALVLVLAVAGPFFIRGPDGKPLIGVKDVQNEISDAGSGVSRQWKKLTARFRPDAKPLPVHRWQDADGNWHFSDEPNPDGSSELIYVDPDDNVIPGFDPGDMKKPNPERGSGTVLDILDDTKNAKDAMEQRNSELEERSEEER